MKSQNGIKATERCSRDMKTYLNELQKNGVNSLMTEHLIIFA